MCARISSASSARAFPSSPRSRGPHRCRSGRRRRTTRTGSRVSSPMVRVVSVAMAFAGLAVMPGQIEAQGILLEIRPTRGDTLHLRLEQSVEMKGTTRVGDRDSTMTVATSMAILARAIILAADSTAARVVTVTDSVIVSGAFPALDAAQDRARRDLRGSRVEMRVLPD